MTLKYLLDTNICIYIAKQKPLAVMEKFNGLSVGQAGMSLITFGELMYGAQKSQNPKKAKDIIEELIHFIPCMPMSTQVGQYYGMIRSHLEKTGKTIGNNDLWIAAHTLELDVTLITNNVKEFSRVKGLKIENWVKN